MSIIHDRTIRAKLIGKGLIKKVETPKEMGSINAIQARRRELNKPMIVVRSYVSKGV